jgi:hypothetical protein
MKRDVGENISNFVINWQSNYGLVRDKFLFQVIALLSNTYLSSSNVAS